MCRIFAYLSSTEPCLLDDVLVTPKHSLVNQVHDHYLPKLLPHVHTPDEEQDMKARNILFNIDGMGVAWYTPSYCAFNDISTDVQELRPVMYKTIQPPSNDMIFRSIAANTETKCCFAHIRAASGSAIANVNNHPFVFGRHCFMHNGVLSDFSFFRQQLSQEIGNVPFANVHGSTDSEHIAALYMTKLLARRHGSSFNTEFPLDDMFLALQETLKTIMKVQSGVLGQKRKPNSLNICVTDGVKMMAMRFRNCVASQPPTLYYSTNAGVTLNRKYPDVAEGVYVKGVSDVGRPESEHGRHVIVASEPSTYKEEDWTLLKKNSILLVEEGTEPRIVMLPWCQEWDVGP